MLSNYFKISIFSCCIFISCTAMGVEQLVPVKSNMGPPDEIFVQRAQIEDLSLSATESNLYFLPIDEHIRGQYIGDIYVAKGTGFTVSEPQQGNSYTSILLTSPLGVKYTIENDQVTCGTASCPLESVNVDIFPAVGESKRDIRAVSINNRNDIEGQWQIQINGLSRQVSPKDFLITHEDSTVLAVRDSDQQSLANLSNKFILELRDYPSAFAVSKDSSVLVKSSQGSYTTINGSEIRNLDAKVTVVPRLNALNTVSLNGISRQYEVDISKDGEISTTIPGLPVGSYSLEVDFTAFMNNGDVIQRTGYYGFPVLDDSITLTGKSLSRVKDNNRLEVKLDVNQKQSGTYKSVVVYAEIWSGDQPVSYINTVANVDEKSQIFVSIDSRWFALAEFKSHDKFDFKNIKLLDPDTFLILDEMSTLQVSVSSFPDAAYSKASEVIIDDSMLYGADDVFIALKNEQDKNNNKGGGMDASGIYLVHGWCDNQFAWDENDFDDGPTEEHNNPTSMSRNTFAIDVRNETNMLFTDWFSGVGHSQGGQALAHLQAYYFSGLDSSPAPRPIQTVGTPYQGSVLMNLYVFSGAGIINDIFNINDCSAQFSLTTPGSFFWSIFLPIATQSDTYYYRTIHELPDNFWEALQFWRWRCNFASFILSGPDDGVVRSVSSWLLFGNNMGITEEQCHTGLMNHPDQRDDLGRNNIMDVMGRVTGTWTAWLDRDDPGGSGDWEHRSGHAGVCPIPIDYQARRVGDGTAANLTGEVLVSNSPTAGLVCRNSDQPDNTCFDYEVRFLCP